MPCAPILCIGADTMTSFPQWCMGKSRNSGRQSRRSPVWLKISGDRGKNRTVLQKTSASWCVSGPHAIVSYAKRCCANTSATCSQAMKAATKRFHGSVILNSTRVGRDASRIADEVISHLAGLVGSTLKVTLEIEAQIPNGAPNNVVRTVTENGRTLKFTAQGFEQD